MSRWNRQVRNIAVLLAVAIFAAPFGAYHPVAIAAGDPGPIIEADHTIPPEENPVPGETPAPNPEAVPFPEETPDSVPEEIPVPGGEMISEEKAASKEESVPEDGIIPIETEEPETVTDIDLPDANLLYKEYLNRKMDPPVSQRQLMSAKTGSLSVYEQNLYALLKEQVARIASGERDDAEIVIPMSDALGKLTFTFEELGITDGSEAKDAVSALLDAAGRRAVMSALFADVPYELYWFDKTAGYVHARNQFSATMNVAEKTVTINDDPNISYSMYISPSNAQVSMTVIFDPAEGGTIEASGAAVKEVVYDDVYGELPVPKPHADSYYVFLGWFTEQSGGERVTANTLVTQTADHTLYAHWKIDEKMERAAAIADLRGGYAGLDRGGLWIYGIQEETEGSHKDYFYTGAPVKLTFTVYFKDMELTEGRDYTVSYKNNVRAANYYDKNNPAVVVKGKGNYAGTITHPYSILPADIGKPETTAPFDGIKDKNGDQTPNITITYNGKVQKPAVRLVSMLSGKAVTLRAGTDYTVSYDTARKVNRDGTDVDPPVSGQIRTPGYYALTVQGKGNFTGTRTVLVEVVVTNAAIASLTGEALRTPVSALSIPNIPAQTYAGGASFVYLPQERISELKSDETLLRTANKAADFAWKIYDKTKKRELEYEKDYYLTYSANSAVGTASVVITGVGDYADSVTKTFQINGTPVSKQTVTGLEKSYVYTGEPIEPPVQLAGLTEGIDYTVSYSNHTAAGTASVVFTGINGYTGTLKRNYKITAYHIANDPENRVRARLAQSMLVYRKGGVRATPLVTYKLPQSGRLVTLREGVDYTLKYANNNTANGSKTPTVTITGKGSFTGTIAPIPFDIIPADIGLYTQVTASDVVFCHKANICKPSVVISDKKTGAKLAAGTDHEKIFTYTYDRDVTVARADGSSIGRSQGDPVDPGDIIPANTPIAVTITGKNNYTGTVRGTFNFVAASISGATLLIGNQTYSGKAVLITEQKQFSKAQIKIGGIWHTLDLGTHIEVVPGSYVNNIASGTAKVTLRGIPANGFGGTKTVSFRIVKKSMDYTIRYNNNLEYLKTLYGFTTDAELAERFRISGTMADSVTTEGGRLRKNAFRIYDKKLGRYLKFLGWVVNENGKQAVYADNGVFNHARMDNYRKYYGNTYTLYAQWEMEDLTDVAYQKAAAYLNGKTVPWDKIVCFGDSLTQWGYPWHVNRQTGAGMEVINKGIAGATVHHDFVEGAYDQRLKSIVDNLTDAEAAGTDAVFLMAGTIDWLSVNPLFVKRPTGDASLAPGTFTHDFDQICRSIKTRFPGKPVFIVMPPKINGTGNRHYDDFRNAERMVAQMHGFTVIDDHVQQGVFTVTNAAIRKLYYSDSVHLSNEGNDVLAAMIMAEALRSMP